MENEILAAEAILSIRSLILRHPQQRTVFLPREWSRKFQPYLGAFASFARTRSPNVFLVEDLSPGIIQVKMSKEFLTQGYLSLQRISADGVNKSFIRTGVVSDDPQYVGVANIASAEDRADWAGGKIILDNTRSVLEKLMNTSPTGISTEMAWKSLSEGGIPPLPLEWFDDIVVRAKPDMVYVAQSMGLPASTDSTMVNLVNRIRACPANRMHIDEVAQILGTNVLSAVGIVESSPLLVFKPDMIFSCKFFEQLVEGYVSAESRREAVELAELASISPLRHLVRTITCCLEISPDRKLPSEHVVAWCNALDVRPRLVWQCLQDKIFWSSPHADMQVVLRKPNHSKQDPVLLEGDDEFPKDLISQIPQEIKQLGAGCSMDKLIGALHWGKSSENRRKYGPLSSILKLHANVFYEPDFVFLKDDLVEFLEIPQSDASGESILAQADADFVNLSRISSTLVYYLTQGGYPFYPVAEARNALASCGLSEDQLLRLRYLFVPGSNIYLRKGFDANSLFEGSIERGIHFALTQSGRKALDFDSLFKALEASGRYSQGDVERARYEVAACGNLEGHNSLVVEQFCFYNPGIVMLDSTATLLLELPPVDFQMPRTTELTPKSKVMDTQ